VKIEQYFGEVLRHLRQEKQISQEKFAEKCGLHRTYISLLERGLKSPTISTVFRIASQLDIPPHQFIHLIELKMEESAL
jgi:transcriptional regulator with XRE-family HTH domain